VAKETIVKGLVVMKTFKLISLHVLKDGQMLDIALEDGLIINREDEQSSWLIEAYTDQTQLPLFQQYFESKEDLYVQVVISKKENDPASFETKVCSVKKLSGHASILFEGRLKRTKNNYAELLLDHLLHKGLDGSVLMEEFKEKMKTRPLLEGR
jgi:hypothetical protein